MPSSAAALTLALTLLAGGAGCADHLADADRTVASDRATSSAATTRTPTPAATGVPEESAPPFTADTRPADGGAAWGAGNGLGLTDVSTSQRSDYDRVVFHLEGSGTPGWRVEYRTNPTGDGSGEPVPLEGTVFLQVILRGIGHPYDTGIAPFGDGATRVPGTGTRGVAEIAPGGFFEGSQQAFIGLTGARRPFRVFALDDPARVVVDVRHP